MQCKDIKSMNRAREIVQSATMSFLEMDFSLSLASAWLPV